MRASDEKLAKALHDAELHEMAAKAEAGYYNEFFGELVLPMHGLMADLITAGTPRALLLVELVKRGDFDATDAEAEEWADSLKQQQPMVRP